MTLNYIWIALLTVISIFTFTNTATASGPLNINNAEQVKTNEMKQYELNAAHLAALMAVSKNLKLAINRKDETKAE